MCLRDAGAAPLHGVLCCSIRLHDTYADRTGWNIGHTSYKYTRVYKTVQVPVQ